MIVGIGTDIVEISRISRAVRRSRFVERVFTEAERKYCLSRARPEEHFAGRFAAKEAVLKALGTGKRGIAWTEVEILPTRDGSPRVCLRGRAAEVARQKGIKEVLVSLSHSREYAVAYAVSLGVVERCCW